MGLTMEQSRALGLDAGIDFSFDFGIDDSGDFYVADPTMAADVSFGDEAMDITAVDTGTASFTVSGIPDPEDQIIADDVIYVSGSDGNEGRYTVVAVTDDGTDTTIAVAEDINSDTVAGELRRTFDLSLSLGPIGIGIDDGVAAFDAGVSLGVE